MIGTRADLVLLSSREGGLKAAMDSPCRSLILHTEAGPGIGTVALGVLISTPSGEALVPGTSVVGARLDFWVDQAELYIVKGQQFELGYPNRIVGRGAVTAVFSAEM